jgi:ketosteroid isomerase-like protein
MIRSDMLVRGPICAAALASLAACAQPSPPAVDANKEAAAINAEDAAMNAAFKAKDADKAVAYDADDIINYAPGAPPITSKAADLVANKALFADSAFTFNFTVDKTFVASSGDLAYQTGAFDQTATNAATKAVDHTTGNWVAVFRKASDGTWKLSAVAATPAAATPAAAAPASNS